MVLLVMGLTTLKLNCFSVEASFYCLVTRLLSHLQAENAGTSGLVLHKNRASASQGQFQKDTQKAEPFHKYRRTSPCITVQSVRGWRDLI